MPAPRTDRLADRARARPEEPFLFFRTPRGHVDWWSWERTLHAGRHPEQLPPDVPDAARAAVEALGSAGEEAWSAAEETAAAIPRSASARPIWLSTRALTRDAPWLRVAVVAGWAVFRDPVDGPAAETFLWARPTMAVGSEPELAELLEAVAALAPVRRAERWLARRLARLDTLVVEPGGDSGALAPALGCLGPATRVVRLPAGEW